jgi:hypothetical protein
MSDPAEGGTNWLPLRDTDPRRLSEARLQTHYAAQWLARVARGYLAPRPDDSHTSLGWEDGGFTTRAINDATQLHLDIVKLRLDLRNKDGVTSLSLDKQSETQVRGWLGDALAARGLQPDRLDAPSPYAMPPHPLAGGGRYDAEGLTDALADLAAWYANAAQSLGRVRRTLLASKATADELRCWPHHFDLATLATFPIKGGETGYVGAGLSPGDHHYDEPYYYVSVSPKPGASSLPSLPKLGHWHTHEFTAAVATARQILRAQRPQAETEAFLHVAVTQAIALLL